MRPPFTAWATEHLFLHDKRGQRAVFPPAWRRILDHCFPAGDDPLPYSRIVWSCPKKSAKSTLAAGVQLWYGWHVETPGEQYVLANDLEGARTRVWRYALAALTQGKAAHRLSGTTITLANGTTIRAIPSDYRGEAGANFSLATVDEPWGVIHESAVRLHTEFSPPPTRRDPLVFYTGYAGWEGQSAFWHSMIDTALAGEAIPELADIEDGDGQPACWRAGRLFLYHDHTPRMAWHTAEYLAEQRRVLAPSEYLRVWENRRVRGADSFLTPAQWDACYDPALDLPPSGDPRPLIFAADAATTADTTALVGCLWTEKRIEVVYTRVWRGRPDAPIQLTETITPEIIALAKTRHVAAVLYDPYQMAAVAELCRRAGVTMIEFPQTAARVQADTHLRHLILGGRLAHDGDPLLREHVLNALIAASDRGVRLIKPTTGGKIDAAVALSMAALGAAEHLPAVRHASLRLERKRNLFFGG